MPSKPHPSTGAQIPLNDPLNKGGDCYPEQRWWVHRRDDLHNHVQPMTNVNTAAAQKSGLKQAATAVAFALAPFAVVIGIATATEMMQPQSANAVGYTQSTGDTTSHWAATSADQIIPGQTNWMTGN